MDNEVEQFKKADMWSVGVLLFIMITGVPPFEGKTTDEIYEKISIGEYSFNGREWDSMPEAKNLIYHLLQFDPNDRFDACEAVNHSFFNK